MAAYKDEERGTWYVSFHYNDWTGKNRRKLKRGYRLLQAMHPSISRQALEAPYSSDRSVVPHLWRLISR